MLRIFKYRPNNQTGRKFIRWHQNFSEGFTWTEAIFLKCFYTRFSITFKCLVSFVRLTASKPVKNYPISTQLMICWNSRTPHSNRIARRPIRISWLTIELIKAWKMWTVWSWIWRVVEYSGEFSNNYGQFLSLYLFLSQGFSVYTISILIKH